MNDAQSLTLALGGRWAGSYGTACCPAHDDRDPSLTLRDGDKAALLYCHAGCESGAVIDALKVRGLWEGATSGAEPDPMEAVERKGEQRRLRNRNIERARAVWHDARSINGTASAVYLRSRGITIPPPPSLRHHTSLTQPDIGLALPCMVAGVQGSNGEVRAIQRTWLRPDGTGKAKVSRAKMALGPISGGAVRLGPAEEELGIAEGIETGLSAMQLFGGSVWCALGGSNMKNVALPELVKRVVIYADAGKAGKHHADAAAYAFCQQGRQVTIRTPLGGLGDFNDVLAKGPGDDER